MARLFGWPRIASTLCAPLLLVSCGNSVNLADTPENPPKLQVVAPNAEQHCKASASIQPVLGNVLALGSETSLDMRVEVGELSNTKGRPHPVTTSLIGVDGTRLELGREDLLPGSRIVTIRPLATLAPGKYSVSVVVGCPLDAVVQKEATAKTDIFAARLGVGAIHVLPGDGARLPLAYHAVDGAVGNYFPLTGDIPATSLDQPEGEAELDGPTGARSFPTPWTDVNSPRVDAGGAVIERGAGYPVSLQTNTKPDLTFHLGKTTRGFKAGASVVPSGVEVTGFPPLRLSMDGETPAPFAAGTATVRLKESPVTSVKRVDRSLTFALEVQGADGAWSRVPGTAQTAVIRFYGVLGNNAGTRAPNIPWVAVVDAALVAVDGKATDAAGVRARLVQLVYEEMSLKYDRKSGASAYTSYAGGYTSATFSLGAFLARSRGNTVNCTDCASILSTYANMVGASLNYAIIGWDFPLHPIMGIGASVAGSPFDSGRFSFRYHAVTTHDATKSIHDATLALDGDSDPKAAPFSKLLVQNLTGAEYLRRLSPGTAPTPEFKYVDQITSVR